jgi:hypothetical protein
MTTCNVYEGQPAADRLAQLGIEQVWLKNAVLAGDAEARTCTRLDPPITGGILRYSRTNRVLREQTIPAGWHFDNRRNLARTINPSRQFAIVVAQGNEFTGDQDNLPITKYPKGITMIEAVASNEQLELDLQALLPEGVVLESEDASTERMILETWVLLSTIVDGEIHYELSRPVSMTGSHIDAWAERIIFAPLPVDPTIIIEEPADEYDVLVERRNRPA